MRNLVFGAVVLAVASVGFNTLITSSLAASRDAKAAAFYGAVQTRNLGRCRIFPRDAVQARAVPGRRLNPALVDSKTALERAKTLARDEQDKID